MKQYNVYTKLDGHIGKFSGGGSDVTKAYVDKQLETKANKTELAEYAKTTEVTKTVSSEIAKVIADAPASFDTLKEISDWIDTHEDSASAMNTAIQKNTADISSLQISKANSTDLTAHTDNSDIHVTLEEKSNFHTHNNKNYLDKISENSSGNLTYDGKEITGGGGNYYNKNETDTLLANKVDKEEGKGLFSGSYNDLTNKPTNLVTNSELDKHVKANDEAKFYFGVLNHKFGYYTTEAREESDFHEFGSSGFHVPPKDVYNVSIKPSDGALTVTWNDPDDTFIEGVDISHWAGTILVMKADTAPVDENDGTVVLTNTVRNQYATEGYVIDGLTNNTTYHLYFIPYNQEGDYEYSDSNRYTGMPAKVMLDDVTNISASGADGSVTVNWTNPEQTKTQDGITATWVKTTVVVKADSQPTSATDGTAYESTDYSVNSHTFTVDNGKDYYVGFFIESDLGSVTNTTYDTATSLYATVTVSTEETTLIGKTVTATYGESGSVSGEIGLMGFVQLKIPYIGEVTLTATDGTDTANKTLTIEEWTSYSVSLSFTIFPIIYSNGEKFTDFDIIRAYSNETTDTCIDDGTKISTVRTEGTSGWNTGGGYIISEPIDFTGYNKLKFRITSHAYYAYVCVFTIFNKKSIASTKEDTTNSTVANAAFSKENVNGVYEMDISNVNGENYLCLINGRYTPYTATFDIHEIWLE